MSNLRTSRCLLLSGPVLLAVLSGCRFSATLTFHNATGSTLTPYPVLDTPAPPHREADPAGDVAAGSTSVIDPHGYNPVWYTEGVSNLGQANGIYVGLAMEEEPYQIQYKVFHYKVAPGQAGHDADKQPILLHSGVVEVEDMDQRITVTTLLPAGEPPPPGGWTVRIRPN